MWRTEMMMRSGGGGAPWRQVMLNRPFYNSMLESYQNQSNLSLVQNREVKPRVKSHETDLLTTVSYGYG